MTRVDFRSMGGRSGRLWVAGTGLVATAMTVCFLVTDVENRPYSVLVLLGLAFGVFVVARAAQWLEVSDEDTVLVQRRTFTTVRVGLGGARDIHLRGNGAGSAQVVASDRSGRTAFAGLLLSSAYAQGYQPAEVVEALVEGVERNRGRNARETAKVLRAQLEHARAGGPVRTAPLAAYALDATGVVAAGGAAGGVSDLP